MTARARGAEADIATDVLIVGAGVAGLSCAIASASRRVTLVTKTAFGEGGNSPWAQGGVAAAMGPDDSGALHARDTHAAGAHLCEAPVVEWLTREGPAAISRLVALGARFDRSSRGDLALGREAAHSRARILHANGDATGAEIVRALTAAVRASSHVAIVERATVDALHVEDGRVRGAWVRTAGGRRLYRAGAVVLATGGAGQLFRHTTNPPEATGDGLVLAARAGAVLADLEFVQFHPTALDVPADPLPLVTEALRGAGAALVDEDGRRFVLDVHPDGELAPRDVVARACWRHAAAGHRVLLDARTAVGETFPQRFPTVFEACRRHGLDPRVRPIPVTPAAHYHMGGIAVDGRGRSSLPGLWACGEAACTGVHGANRLASNSLLEALVFGTAVAGDIGAARPGTSRLFAPADDVRTVAPAPGGGPGADADLARVRTLMWQHAGLVRTAAGLSAAVAELAAIEVESRSRSARDLALLGRMIATSALAREESRGAHWRADFPQARDAWRRRSFARLAPDGTVVSSPGPTLTTTDRWPASTAAESAA